MDAVHAQARPLKCFRMIVEIVSAKPCLLIRSHFTRYFTNSSKAPHSLGQYSHGMAYDPLEHTSIYQRREGGNWSKFYFD